MENSAEVEINERQLTPDYATKLFVGSFRFSQGTPELQGHIFDYLHRIRPEWKISDELKQEVYSASRERIQSFLRPVVPGVNEPTDKPLIHTSEQAPGEDLSIKGIDCDIRSELAKMQAAFNSTNTLSNDELLRDLTAGIIDRDYYFLCELGGRPRKQVPENAKNSPVTDPWLSHLCYYALEANNAGLAEYDEMFADIKKYVRAINPTSLGEGFITGVNLYKALHEVVRVYEDTHPEAEFSLYT